MLTEVLGRVNLGDWGYKIRGWLAARGYIPPCFATRVQKVLKTKKVDCKKRAKREKE
jgi:hypothetical protein